MVATKRTPWKALWNLMKYNPVQLLFIIPRAIDSARRSDRPTRDICMTTQAIKTKTPGTVPALTPTPRLMKAPNKCE